MGQPRRPTTPPARDSQDGPLPVRGSGRPQGSPSLAQGATSPPQVGPALRTIYPSASHALEDGWFFARVEKTVTCWLWRGNKKGFDYGCGPKGEYAHRWAYRRFVGAIPDGMYVLHRCDTPLCVNYEHLFLGTQSDNLNDAVAKGRVPLGSQNYRAKLTEAIVAEARRRWHQGTACWTLAREYGVSTHTMDFALKRKTWKHVP